MIILLTISDPRRLALVVDLQSGSELEAIPTRPNFFDQEAPGRPACRPFGITWTADELLIANNRQLLVFSKSLEFRRTLETRLQVNTHQLSFYLGRVWAVSPWTNSLIGVQPHRGDAVELDLLTHTLRPYTDRDAREDDDKCHFNSLLWADGSLFVAAHSFGASSFIFQYEERTFRLTEVYRDVGASLHGLGRHQRELFWISTRTNDVRSDKGYRLPLVRRGYARGFAMTDDYFIVAISELLARGERHGGDSWVQVVDRHDRVVVQEVHLPDSGSINDLRLLDHHDHAHGIDPVWGREQ